MNFEELREKVVKYYAEKTNALLEERERSLDAVDRIERLFFPDNAPTITEEVKGIKALSASLTAKKEPEQRAKYTYILDAVELVDSPFSAYDVLKVTVELYPDKHITENTAYYALTKMVGMKKLKIHKRGTGVVPTLYEKIGQL